ncbi:MAG: hypothetical protein JO305_00710 [Alphaproteobacteria bacterium]|nr:hypothetical protein [Alphaproteobacteria bacterium]
MRSDMLRVIVERPRRGGINRRGRSPPIAALPLRESMHRPYYASGRRKEFNDNLAPLLRYLERQVGRPWDKIYGEIAVHSRGGGTMQQHLRNHLSDFVAVKPRLRNGWYFAFGRQKQRFSRLWHQPLYVDEKDGILKRTDLLPEEKARRRARGSSRPG